MKMSPCKLLLLFFILHGVLSLESPARYSEGSCAIHPPKAIRASREVMDKLKYVAAGSKFLMYSIASTLPSFSYISEDQLKSNGCYTRNTTTTSKTPRIGGIFGFGRPLIMARVVPSEGVYFEATPVDPSQSWNTITDVVTLTDHKSYAVVRNCFNGIDRRSWALITLTPKISPHAKKRVVEHVLSMGFRRENFVFLNYDKCPNRFFTDIYD